MTDLISRAEAIEIVKAMVDINHDSNDKLILAKVWNQLKDMPSAEPKHSEWIPLQFDGMTCDFPYERDGQWVIVTNGKTISVERIKKDAYDHFYPNGRWFELDEVIAWMPLPELYKDGVEP